MRNEKTVGASTLKSILVYVQSEEAAALRIEAALSIARANSAHVTALLVTPVEAYGLLDHFGGTFVMSDVMKSIADQAGRLRSIVEELLSGEDVSWDCVQVTGNVATEIVSHAALADIVIAGREAADVSGASMTLLGDLVHRLRTPLFLPGAAAVDPTGPALIAWDGSYEAANAARNSLGLLRHASSVRVMHVGTNVEVTGAFPGTRLVEYLSRQGIHAELIVETLPDGEGDDFVAASLISHTLSSRGAFLIMGGYGRSRVRQFLLGGVTRTMLSASSVPVVIAR